MNDDKNNFPQPPDPWSDELTEYQRGKDDSVLASLYILEALAILAAVVGIGWAIGWVARQLIAMLS